MDLIDSFQKVYTEARRVDPCVFLVLSKSDNKNLIVYKTDSTDINFNGSPVTGYWQTWEELQEDNPTIDKLSVLEKKLAFGIKSISASDKEYTFYLSAYPKIPITIRLSPDGKIESTMVFSGMEYRLLGMHIIVNPSKPCSKPKGINLMVQLPLPGEGDTTEWSHLFSIYLDAKVVIE